ncbi:MAG: hypothetical protein ACE5E5_14805, partial [Phycisphaerae bacterium]
MSEPGACRHETPNPASLWVRVRVVCLVFLLVFACEFAVMMVLPLLGVPAGNWEAAADSALLSLLLVPGLILLGLLRGGHGRDERPNASPQSRGWWDRLCCLRNQYIAVLTLLSVGPVIWLSHSIQSEISAAMEEKAYEMADLTLDRSERELGLFLEQMRRDAVSIAHYPPIHGLLRCRDAGGVDPVDGSTAAQWRSRLESLFVAFGSARQDAFQIRFIDEEGQEWVRAESLSGSLAPVPASQLQDKSTRPYYRNAIHLPEGQCHITDLDLNKEHGRVQVPHRSVIRVSTPVWFEGRPRGVVVINYRPQFLLGGLEWMNDGEFFLASQEGVY